MKRFQYFELNLQGYQNNEVVYVVRDFRDIHFKLQDLRKFLR